MIGRCGLIIRTFIKNNHQCDLGKPDIKRHKIFDLIAPTCG